MKRKATDDHNNRDRKVPRFHSLATPQQQSRSSNELTLPVVISSSESKGRKAYYDKWQRAINDECAAELSQVRERIQSWPLTRLVHEGYTLIDQHVTDLNHVPTLLVKFQYQSRGAYPLNHRFNHGDAVLITRTGHVPLTANNSTNQGHKYQWEGVVVERGIRHIWVQYTSGGVHMTSLRTLLEEEHATAEQFNGPHSATNNGNKSRGWRIDRGPSTVTFDRMSYALQLFTGQKLTNHVTVRNTWSEDTAPYNSVFQALLMDLQSPAEITRLAAEQPGLWGSASLNSARDIDHVIPEWRTWQLNDSQRNVISHVINRRLSLIQGPPGTGKTYTAVHLMKVMTVLAQHMRAKNSTGVLPLLATAFTNVAVDNLLEGLLKLGVRAVRVGRSVKIREELRAVSLEVQMTRDRRYPRLEEITQEITRLETSQRRSVKQRDNSVNAEVDKSLAEKRRELRQIMREIQRDILSRAEVIVGTVVGVGDYELLSRDVKFQVVLMDEASQCSEPALLIPLVRSRDIKQLVLLGDHYQLPPTSIKGNDAVLTISPFQRLAGHTSHVIQLDDPLTPSHVPLISPNLLQYQYRMHPDIAHFPSMYFYKGKIFNAVQRSDRPLPAGFPWPVSGAEQHPVVFIDVPLGVEEAGNVGLGKSFMNREEAKQVMAILRRLLTPVRRQSEHVTDTDITYFDDDSGFEMVLDTAAKNSAPQLSTSDIGIITPYSGQVRHISDLISRDKFFTQFRAKLVISPRKSNNNSASRDSVDVTLADEGENSQTLVEGGLNVASVDGFQGREKEIIIFSAVRSNPEHRVGFLNDWRRLNVALTRARSGLIVLGHRETLMHDPHWRAWLLFMDERQWCVSLASLTDTAVQPAV